ncbi:De-etiolated protein 1 Det1-domain-containing protein [Obelidium mucronatum]|nr:De-etiolated protein 1 Det1-domain-containing protein [Obelidium mucronatum]
MFKVLREREVGGIGPRVNMHRRLRRAVRSLVPNTTSRCVSLDGVSHVLGFEPGGAYLLCLSQANHAVLALVLDTHTSTRTQFARLFEAPLAFGGETLARDFCLFHGAFVVLASAAPLQSPQTPAQTRDNRARFPHALESVRFLDDITLWLLCARSGAVLDKLAFPADHILLTHAAGVQIHRDGFMAVTSIKNQTIHLFHLQDSGRFVKLREIGWHNNDDDEYVLAQSRTAEEIHAKSMGLLNSSQSSSSSSSSFVSANFYRQMQQSAAAPPESPKRAAGGPIRGIDMRRTLRRVGRASILSRIASNNEAPLPEFHPHAEEDGGLVVPQPTLLMGPDTVGIALNRGPALSGCLDPKNLPFSGIKQRVMSFLYRQALDYGTPAALRHFYLTFDQFTSLVMWRMQFLDHDTILIKFGGFENAVGRNTEPSTSQPCFFVIYSLKSTNVSAVFDNSSHDLLELYQSWPQFRGGPVNHVNFVSTACNNIYAREYVKKQLYSVRKAKNGGVSQAVKRILCTLPVNPQLYIESPLLDQTLFNYDEALINNINRPRAWSGEFPVKFWDRRTNQIKFKIDPNPAPSGSAFAAVLGRAKKYVSYHFHPTDPFIISAMTIVGQGTFYNFHFRADSD